MFFSTSPMKTSSKYSLFRPISSNICQTTEPLFSTIPSDALPTHSVYVDHYLSQMSLEECYPYHVYSDNQSHIYDIQRLENSSYSSIVPPNTMSSLNVSQFLNHRQKTDNEYICRSTARLPLLYKIHILSFVIMFFCTFNQYIVLYISICSILQHPYKMVMSANSLTTPFPSNISPKTQI